MWLKFFEEVQHKMVLDKHWTILFRKKVVFLIKQFRFIYNFDKNITIKSFFSSLYKYMQ